MFSTTLSKGSPLPFEQKELGPDGRPIIGLFYFKIYFDIKKTVG